MGRTREWLLQGHMHVCVAKGGGGVAGRVGEEPPAVPEAQGSCSNSRHIFPCCRRQQQQQYTCYDVSACVCFGVRVCVCVKRR